MPVLTASPTLGDLLKFELNASYTRETVTLKAGTSYPLGSVLGRITASGEFRLSPAAEVVGDEGAETAIGVLLEAVDATDAALVFDASVDQPTERAAKIIQLATVGLVARATV